MPALVVIPARYASTRFPGKALAPLDGKPLIQHVYENSTGSRLASEVIVATDSTEILEAVESFGGKAVMTSAEHPSGTDRIAEAASETDYDIIVNVQGDEPLMRPEIIDSAIGLLDDGRASMGTLAARIKDSGEIPDPNVVKVVFDAEGFALYFSRAPIPYHRQQWKSLRDAEAGSGTLYRHIGIYSYRRDVLMRLTGLEPSALERTEKLEQLRALENGMRIKVGVTEHETMGVDTPEDLERVKKCLSTSS
jgi:3-deoxy-manno-octulosonate cytidylyltransferase (CMP-KDO synthetase)